MIDQVTRVPLSEAAVDASGRLQFACPECATLIVFLMPGTKREGFADASNRLACGGCGALLELDDEDSATSGAAR